MPKSDDKPTIFVSYSHRDEVWKDRLMPYLEVLQLSDQVELWDDTRIGTGDDWFDEIMAAMDRASVAICLITVKSLASKFIRQDEFPYLLERRRRDGLWFVPILIEPSPWETINWLKHIQMFPGEGMSLIELDEKVALKKVLTEASSTSHAATLIRPWPMPSRA